MPEPDNEVWKQFLHRCLTDSDHPVSGTAELSNALVSTALLADLLMTDATIIDDDPEWPGMVRATAVQVGTALLTALRTPEAHAALLRIIPTRVAEDPMVYYRGVVMMVYGLAELISSYTASLTPASLVKGAVTAWTAAVSLFVTLADADPENLWVDMLSSPGGSEAPGSVPEDGKGHQRSQEGM